MLPSWRRTDAAELAAEVAAAGGAADAADVVADVPLPESLLLHAARIGSALALRDARTQKPQGLPTGEPRAG